MDSHLCAVFPDKPQPVGFRRGLARALVIVIVGATLMPLGSIAEADHGTRTLQVISEISSVGVGSSVTVTATVYTANGSATEPAATNFPINVDFEITGPGDPDSSDTPGTPDSTCPIPGGSATCTMTFSSTQTGTSLVRAWIRDASIDSTEGRISDAYAPQTCSAISPSLCPTPTPFTPTNITTDCISPDPPTYCDSDHGAEVAGTQPEPDQTDVVEVVWNTGVAAKLDCNPELSTNPSAGAGSTANFVCMATDSLGNSISGTNIDGENMGGANDPDNSGTPSSPTNTTADYTQTSAPQGMGCTTGSDGTCTASINPDEGEAGLADICFWADTDSDDTFATDTVADGDGCGEAVSATENADLTDKVQVDWKHPRINCDPESSTNPTTGTGSTASFVCTAHNESGGGVSGVRIDGENMGGANDPDDSGTPSTPTNTTADYTQGFPPQGRGCTTTVFASGACTATVAAFEGQAGPAVICFWADTDNPADNAFGPDINDGGYCATETVNDPEFDNSTDKVLVTWEGRVATYLDVRLETATSDLGTTYTVTATVYDQFGVTFTGFTDVKFEFFSGSPSDTPGSPDKMCTTPNSSSCSMSYTQATVAGTDLICAWIGVTPTMSGTNAGGTCNGEGLTDSTNEDASPSPPDDNVDVVKKQWGPELSINDLSINDVTVTEGNAATTTATFTVTMSSASGQTVTVNYTTADGTATAPADYTSATGTVTFAPGTTTQTVNISVVGDTLDEPDENFFVNLSNPNNAMISDPEGIGTITNNDQCGGPYNEPSLNDLARDVEMYDSCSGIILDGYGGVHPIGDAEAVVGLPYFPNFDIARELVLVFNQTGTVTGGFVLDGWGGMHPFRTANGTTPAPIQNLPYFPGNDIARDAVLTGFNQTLGYHGGYMLDGRGGVHPFGGNSAVTGLPYFSFDIARELVLQDPATGDSPGYILDGYGGMHPFKGAPLLTGLPYFPGNDIANDALLTNEANSGYMLDGYGGIHPFGDAPAVVASNPYTAGVDRYKAFDLRNSSAGVVLDGSGKLWDFLIPS